MLEEFSFFKATDSEINQQALEMLLTRYPDYQQVVVRGDDNHLRILSSEEITEMVKSQSSSQRRRL